MPGFKRMIYLGARKLYGMIKKPRKMISHYEEYCTEINHRALVSYLIDPLLPPPNLRNKTQFSNRGLAQYIPRALNELGFSVDIINFDNTDIRISDEYDLFIGHGGINFEIISRQMSQTSVQIYFSTGIYWREWNRREARRFLGLTERTGYLIQPDRYIEYSEEYANQIADGIICLGNQNAVRSYEQFPLVIGVNNGVFPINISKPIDKDFHQGRNNFLFFAGPGNIHKGLDLLFEAFLGTPRDLHVCQIMRDDFVKIYQQDLENSPNIHLYQHIPMRSELFVQLAKQCNWIISASCAEGQPGAVLECMAYGLIPVLTGANNINLQEFGVEIPDSNIEEIRTVVTNCSKMELEKCAILSKRTREAIQESYMPEHFLINFKNAVREIFIHANKITL